MPDAETFNVVLVASLAFVTGCFVFWILEEYLLGSGILVRCVKTSVKFLLYPFLIMDPELRKSFRNERMERRLKKLKYKAQRKKTSEQLIAQLDREYESMQKELGEFVFKHPDVWVNTEGKKCRQKLS